LLVIAIGYPFYNGSDIFSIYTASRRPPHQTRS
jgi:hypothetical protein